MQQRMTSINSSAIITTRWSDHLNTVNLKNKK